MVFYMKSFFAPYPKEPLIIDYSGRDLTNKNLENIIASLQKNQPPIYELNLLETGITANQIRRLYPAVMDNTSLAILKIQIYADHPLEIQQSISEMQEHAGKNNLVNFKP